MLDSFILQIVLTAVCFAAATWAVAGLITGITRKSAAWIITFAMPFALVAAIVISFVIA